MGTALGSRSASAVIGVEQSLPSHVVVDISGALTNLVADVFALYLKTKSFHWHMSGPHFRDYHLLLDEQADQVFAMVDAVAERCRKIGGRRSGRWAKWPAGSGLRTLMSASSPQVRC